MRRTGRHGFRLFVFAVVAAGVGWPAPDAGAEPAAGKAAAKQPDLDRDLWFFDQRFVFALSFDMHNWGRQPVARRLTVELWKMVAVQSGCSPQLIDQLEGATLGATASMKPVRLLLTGTFDPALLESCLRTFSKDVLATMTKTSTGWVIRGTGAEVYLHWVPGGMLLTLSDGPDLRPAAAEPLNPELRELLQRIDRGSAVWFGLVAPGHVVTKMSTEVIIGEKAILARIAAAGGEAGGVHLNEVLSAFARSCHDRFPSCTEEELRKHLQVVRKGEWTEFEIQLRQNDLLTWLREAGGSAGQQAFAGGVAAAPVVGPVSPGVRFVSHAELEKQRLIGEDDIPPPKRARKQMRAARVRSAHATIKVCLSAEGTVESVESGDGSGYPDWDRVLQRAVRGWRYRPYVENGQAVPVCTIVVFLHREQPR